MIEIDAKLFTDKEEFYRIVNEELDFDYEVRNLDALFDQLSCLDDRLRVVNYGKIYENLGDFGSKVIGVFLEAVKMDDVKIEFVS